MKNTIVTVKFPRFGSLITLDFIKANANATKVEKVKTNSYGPLAIYSFVFDGYRDYAVAPFLKFLRETFNPNFISFEMREEDMFKTPWEEYEHRLQHHDWYYHFSDDHRVWSAGEAAARKIKALREQLSKEDEARATELYDKYKPCD